MLMGPRNSQLLSLGKQHGHKLSTRRLVLSWGSTTEIMWRLGWLLIFIKIGFSSGIVNLEKGNEKYFSFKITFLAISFLLSSETSELYSLSQAPLCMSSWKTKASSNASKPTTMPMSHQSLWWRYNAIWNLYHQLAIGNADHRCCMAWCQYNDNLLLLAQSRNLTRNQFSFLSYSSAFNPNLFSSPQSCLWNRSGCSCREASWGCTWWFGHYRGTSDK